MVIAIMSKRASRYAKTIIIEIISTASTVINQVQASNTLVTTGLSYSTDVSIATWDIVDALIFKKHKTWVTC